MDRLEELFASVERTVYTSIQSIDVPDIREAANKLWLDISRYGPEVHMPRIPGLGDFEIPPAPVPPPPPPTLYERAWDWSHDHPWRSTSIAAGILGTGLLVGYNAHRRSVRVRRLGSKTSERRKVIVVLGADTPHGEHLVAGLEVKEYIVIASVATPEAADALEKKSNGYVKALVLDPEEPGTVPVFLRSLSSCLSRKFPLNSPGDPFAPPSALPYIHSVINLMSLLSPPLNAPLEHLSLRDTFLPYLSSSHIVPLQVIQALMPLFRSGSGRHVHTKKSIIFCVPAMDARVGLPFASVQAMATGSTLRAAEVLRREINAAALTDKTDALKHLRVVVIDVGAFNVDSQRKGPISPEDVYKAMENWTASEKVTYGPAFASVAYRNAAPAPERRWQLSQQDTYGVPRKPTDISVFVQDVLSVVGHGVHDAGWIGVGRVWSWLRGERFASGAGAFTYQWASHLPPLILDTLLSIPHYLISVRNALLPVGGNQRAIPPSQLPPPVSAAKVASHPRSGTDSQPSSEVDSGNEGGSEADVESNSGMEGSGVADSWVSLNDRPAEESV